MDDRTKSPASGTGSETPTDEERIIEQTSVVGVVDSDSQDNRHPVGEYAVDPIHQVEEAFVGNSPGGGDSGNEAGTEGAVTVSPSAALAIEHDTNDAGSARDAMLEISDQPAAERPGLDDEMMQTIIAAAMEAADDDDSYDYTSTSSYLTERSASVSHNDQDRHADTGPLDGPADADQVSEHPMRTVLERAIKEGDLERLHELLSLDPQLANVRVWRDPDDGTFMTPLCSAVTDRQPRIVEALLQSGTDVDALAPWIEGGISALHAAAIMGNYTSVRLLLSQGAFVDIQRAGGTTPLHDAIVHQEVDIVECLLDSGASPLMRNDQGSSAFHLAAMFDGVQMLDLLLAAAPDTDITEVNASKNAPLHIASMKNCSGVVRWLLDKGANVDQVGEYERTPLHLASMHGHDIIVATLLEKEARIEQLDCGSRTPLLLACLHLQGEVMKTLFDHYASATAVDSGERGCLHLVIEGHYSAPEGFEAHPEYLNYLVVRGAVVDQPDRRGSTPLMDACQSHSRELIETLLDLGADINGQDPMNRTPLFYACLKPDNGCVDILLSRGADATLAMTGGFTPLHAACSWGVVDNVRTLLKYNVPVTALDVDGNTPLVIAAGKGFVDIMLELVRTREYFPEDPAAQKAFIEPQKPAAKVVGVFSKGFEENRYSFDSDLQPLLHWAVSHGRFELMRQCFKYRPDAVFWTVGGATWLHVAAQYGHSGIINNLLGKVNPAREARGGLTALHVAATHGHLETAQALLQIIAGRSRSPDEASCAKATAIIHWDNKRESPVTLSISRKHKRLQALFFTELQTLGSVTGDPINAIKASELLEILAEWEKPGREVVLKYLLERWLPAPPQTDVRHWSALHWAVYGSTAVVVWWLLSKGGYRSGDEIKECRREPLVRTDAIGMIIQDLLRNPPPQMYEIVNPIDDKPPFPPRPTDWTDQRLYLHGYIMNVYLHNENAVVPYARATLHGIIYSQGPNALIKGVEMLEQRDLNILKKKLGSVSSDDQGLPNIWNLSEPPSGALGRPVGLRLPRYDYSAISPAENLKLRWIHLPVNEVRLRRALALPVERGVNRQCSCS
jgi:ankyrin repeat protein